MHQPSLKHPAIAAHASRSRAGWIVAGVVAAIAVVAAIWMTLGAGDAEPRLTDSTDTLVRFVNSSAFDALPYDKQRQFYKVFDDREKQIDQAFRERKMTEAQYRAA